MVGGGGVFGFLHKGVSSSASRRRHGGRSDALWQRCGLAQKGDVGLGMVAITENLRVGRATARAEDEAYPFARHSATPRQHMGTGDSQRGREDESGALGTAVAVLQAKDTGLAGLQVDSVQRTLLPIL